MAYVVSKRSAVNSVVSMVMFAVLRLMVNFSYETKCINKKNRKEIWIINNLGFAQNCGAVSLPWCFSWQDFPGRTPPGNRSDSLGISSAVSQNRSHGSIFFFLSGLLHIQTSGYCNSDKLFFFNIRVMQLNPNAAVVETSPVLGPWSRRMTACLEEWYSAVQRERRLHPPLGWGGQRESWWLWSPAPPAAGRTRRTPGRHLHLCK